MENYKNWSVEEFNARFENQKVEITYNESGKNEKVIGEILNYEVYSGSRSTEQPSCLPIEKCFAPSIIQSKYECLLKGNRRSMWD